jgi:hypothetical protein
MQAAMMRNQFNRASLAAACDRSRFATSRPDAE